MYIKKIAISWISYLGLWALYTWKDDPPNFYKIESALESNKWGFHGCLENIVFLGIFLQFIYDHAARKTISTQRTGFAYTIMHSNKHGSFF
jgi:hypothetical protein